MARVKFSSELQAFTGETETIVEARVYRDVVGELLQRYPDLKQSEIADMAVAIDGVIIVDPMLEAIGEDSEVHFLHFVAGG